jgi:large repetitive protein
MASRLVGLVLLVAASCSAPAPSLPPAAPITPSVIDQQAVALGVTVLAAGDRGAPRLIRATNARPAAPGLTGAGAARDHLQALAPLYLQRARPADLVERGTQALAGGTSVVTFQQQVDQVDIDGGTVRVMLAADQALAAVSGTLRHRAAPAPFQRDARTALRRALEDRFGAHLGTAASAGATLAGAAGGYERFTVAPTGALAVRSARVKRVLVPDGAALVPAWIVELQARLAGKVDAVHYVVADTDQRVLRKTDLVHHEAVRYRTYADATGDRVPFDGPLASYQPHPTGRPDATLPAPIAPNVVTMDAFNVHRDPWLPADATTTIGNNVETFANRIYADVFEDGDVRPEIKPGRLFNVAYDVTREPLATPNQGRASAVNLFYVTNWLHDWYYDAGFTEVTGNAQADNFGRGGLAGDRLIAQAQDDALGSSRDGAFMAVPADGESPTMYMLLFSAAVEATVTSGGVTYGASYFYTGTRNFQISGRLALAVDGVGDPSDGCEPLTEDLSGKIVLLDYSYGCSEAVALANAQASGAKGAVLWMRGGAFDLGGLPGSFRALAVGDDAGEAFAAALAAGTKVNVVLRHAASGVEHDAALDNGIIAHEWGHYLHLRLAECYALQCSGMSEGWGDFLALHLQLRAEDDRRGTFTPGGVYAASAGGFGARGFGDPAYFSIRRFPYSTNRAKNALGLEHIAASATLPAVPRNPGTRGGNTEVHSLGEVWASMLWEAYNAIIDRRSFADARRRMSEYVVAGLLLTPPNATFTEARDALHAAVGAIDRGDMLAIAAAFARRGAGTCAIAPPGSSETLDEVVADATVSGRLEATAGGLADDDASCDHDGYLDRGERGLLRVRVANGGVAALGGVTVTVTTATPGIEIGAPVVIGALAPFQSVEVAVPVTVGADAPVDTDATFTVEIDGTGGCATGTLVLETTAVLGRDDVPDSSATDTVEAIATPWQARGEGAAALWSRSQRAPGAHAWIGAVADSVSDTALVSPVLAVSATEPLVITLAHAHDFAFYETDFYDGGVIEVSTDDGATWRDVAELGAAPYPASIHPDYGNPLAGRPAFVGRNASYPAREPLVLDFGAQLAGQAVRLRFRIGADPYLIASTGWELDDIAIAGIDNTPFATVVADAAVCAP